MIVAGIPSYNEEKTIAKVILLAQKHVDAVVICDDGSQDLTADIAQKLGAIVIRHERNMGYGAAIQSLFRKAIEMNADVMVTLDADGQHNPEEIPSLIQPLLQDKADIVIGSRFLGQHSDIPIYRRFGIKLITKMSKGSKPKTNAISDAQSGFRAYNSKVIQILMLSEKGMGVSAEILWSAREQGFRVTEVPVGVRYKGLDTSTRNPVKHGLSVISTIVKIVVEERPLVYLGIPGAMSIFVGVFFGLWMLQIFTVERQIITNLALASLAFILIGMFTVFTAITLYAIIRLSEKQRKQHRE